MATALRRTAHFGHGCLGVNIYRLGTPRGRSAELEERGSRVTPARQPSRKYVCPQHVNCMAILMALRRPERFGCTWLQGRPRHHHHCRVLPRLGIGPNLAVCFREKSAKKFKRDGAAACQVQHQPVIDLFSGTGA